MCCFLRATLYPAREQVSIVYSAAAPVELVISDLHGRILHRRSTNPAQSGASTTSTISLRTYPPGVYHVQLTTATTRRNTLFLVYWVFDTGTERNT
ncbi:MAG: T9SS type A sorting domain-containing protein [Ignavibacteriae bacterium]|nr:T9SS type A sorting domain-containing protein [Ignavibacteriota bacterium]